jgi:hypothetical protein
MGLGSRIFLVNDDGSLQRLSLARYERLLHRDPKERLPQYAGKRIRYVLVVLEIENRRPTEVILVQYSYLSFDSEGRIDAAEREKQASLAVDIVPPLRKECQTGQLINAHYRFAKKRYDYEYKWTASPQIRAAIGKAIFGKGQ